MLEKLDEKLYNNFYNKCEEDRDINGKFSKKMSKLGEYGRYICGTLSVGSGGLLTYGLTNNNASLEELILESGLTIAGTALTIHLHDMKKIYDDMYRKNTGEILTQNDIVEVKKTGKIGRYAHFGAGTALLGTFVTAMFLDPIFLILAPTLPFWYHYVINKGYGALYSSTVDYVVGERKQF